MNDRSTDTAGPPFDAETRAHIEQDAVYLETERSFGIAFRIRAAMAEIDRLRAELAQRLVAAADMRDLLDNLVCAAEQRSADDGEEDIVEATAEWDAARAAIAAWDTATEGSGS